MKMVQRLFQTSLGKKYLMALTGLGLFVFVLGHLLGNLQIFLGREAINSYGAFLQSKPGMVWLVRGLLLATVSMHLWAAITLTRENRAARPVAYSDQYTPVASSYASRTMVMSGLIVAAFIIYHLLHFTVQTPAVNLTGQNFLALTDAQGRHDIFAVMITGFRQPVVALFYVIAMALLCLHLSHGVSALTQSLGLKTEALGTSLDRFAVWIAWAIFAGYSSIPIAVLLGYGKAAVK